MQVTQTKSEGLTREYRVVVPVDKVQVELDARLKDVSKNLKVPGFRAGKVPANVVRQRYGKEVQGDVLQNLIENGVQKITSDHELRLAGSPSVSVVSFEEGKDFEFDVNCEIFPPIPDVDLSKIAFERLVLTVSEKEIEESLERLRKSNKKFVVVSEPRAAQKGDGVRVDFSGTVEGVALEGGSAENVDIELGSNTFIPGFEEQLIGAKAGEERQVNVSFPETYHKRDIAGKPAEFKVTVRDVLSIELPAVDEEFAKGLGFESVETLREGVIDQVKADVGEELRAFVKKRLFDVLDEKIVFDVPASVVQREFDSIWKAHEAEHQGHEHVHDPKEKDSFKDIARRRIKLGLFVSEFSKKHSIEVTQEEIRDAIFEQARAFPGQEHRVFEFYQKNPRTMQQLSGPILENKTVDVLLAQMKVTEKPISVDAFIEILKAEKEEVEKEK